ncbi:MAG: hypothetical protein ACOYVF_02300 [Candidatus Zixiibacteriota bacterium]
MKIAVSSVGPDITARVDLMSKEPKYWIIYDSFNHSFEVLDGYQPALSPSDHRISVGHIIEGADFIITSRSASADYFNELPAEIGSSVNTSLTVNDAIENLITSIGSSLNDSDHDL